MFKEYTDFVRLITPGHVDYYNLETGTKNELGKLEGSIDSYFDSFNGCKKVEELEEKLAIALTNFEKGIINKCSKYETALKIDFFLIELKQEMMNLLKVVVNVGVNNFIHRDIKLNQLDFGYYSEFGNSNYYHIMGIHPFIKICNQYVLKAEKILEHYNYKLIEEKVNELKSDFHQTKKSSSNLPSKEEQNNYKTDSFKFTHQYESKIIKFHEVLVTNKYIHETTKFEDFEMIFSGNCSLKPLRIIWIKSLKHRTGVNLLIFLIDYLIKNNIIYKIKKAQDLYKIITNSFLDKNEKEFLNLKIAASKQREYDKQERLPKNQWELAIMLDNTFEIKSFS